MNQATDKEVCDTLEVVRRKEGVYIARRRNKNPQLAQNTLKAQEKYAQAEEECAQARKKCNDATKGHATKDADSRKQEAEAKREEAERRKEEAETRKKEAEAAEEAEAESVKDNLIGLALSGGGIRSATTNLGVLQALSKMGILPMVDYLCTVSGGGYIGSCLSALLSLNKGSVETPGTNSQFHFPIRSQTVSTPTEPKNREDGPLFTTEWERFPFRDKKGQDVLDDKGQTIRLTGPTQIKHLRTHGNFLIARRGIFTRETMRSVGNLLTGIVYHLAIVLAALFLFSAVYVGAIQQLVPTLHEDLQTSDSPLSADITITTTQSITINSVTGEGTTTHREIRSTLEAPTLWGRLKKNGAILWQAVEEFFGNFGQRHLPFSAAAILGVLLAILSFLFLVMYYKVRVKPQSASPKIPEGAEKGESAEDVSERRALWLVTLITLLLALGGIVGIRMVCNPDSILWLFLPFVVFLGARLTSILLHAVTLCAGSLWEKGFRSLSGSFQAIMTYGIVLTLALGLLPLLIYAMKEHGIVAGMLAILSLIATRLLVPYLTGTVAGKRALPLALTKFTLGLAVGLFVLLIVVAFCTLIITWWDPWFSARVSLVVFVALGFLFNYNKLALHYFYRDRLIETYLRTEVDKGEGAMHLQHDTMEMPLTHLHGTGAAPDKTDAKQWTDSERIWGCTAPYHLLLAAINLAGSRDLTRKDRKSGHFIFSKLYCGSEQTKYRRTGAYRSGDTKLARAMTISGAAAASAMGYYTFFAQAFAMTLFNLRLGYWLENPGRPKSRLTRKERCVFWPWYLGKEMFSFTRASDHLVNLSDGGHTGDNVGIYPLLQRRCKIIIACDAEADGNLTFGSFTETLRHAYIDMGIDVDIDLTMIRPDPQTGRSRSHCAVGRIRYPDRKGQQSWLIYLKNSLTRDEPQPIVNYARDHPSFPHETTADQFFDDAQFESYRALGVHIAEHTFGPWVASDFYELCPNMKGWFGKLQRRYSPFAPGSPSMDDDENQAWTCLQFLHSPFKAIDDPAAFQRLADAFAGLDRLFLEDSELTDYYEECCRQPDETLAMREAGTGPTRKIRHVAMIQIQLMERAFVALRLDRYANAPDNRGWMNRFRGWAKSPRFNCEFDARKATLSPEFVVFYERYIRARSSMEKSPVPHPWDDPERKGIYLDPGRLEAEPPKRAAQGAP